MKDQTPFLEELCSLACLASMRGGLTLKVGALDANWSFNWDSSVITVNGFDLEHRSPDFCRGLILHEAAHAAVTRLHAIVPHELHRENAVLHLLNVIEDCRIETWLPARLPGSAPWIRLYNDITINDQSPHWKKIFADHPPLAFLLGIIFRWWTGSLPSHISPLAAEAIERVWPHCLTAIQCLPPVDAPPEYETRAAYDSHPVSRCYRDQPSPMEMAIRLSQHGMWTIVWQHILPELRRLIEETGMEPPPFCPTQEVNPTGAGSAIADPSATLGDPASSSMAGLGKLRQQLDTTTSRLGGTGDYANARNQLSPIIEPLAEAILRHLTAETRLRYRRFQSRGQRLDLRLAMQFEADPRIYNRLWQQRILPSKPDPAFAILVDTSGSMKGANAVATFEALVILREVCLRTGIPLAVLAFDNSSRMLQDWNVPTDPQAIKAIESVRHPKGSSTNMAPVLKQARLLCDEAPYRDRYVWLLSDGKPDDRRKTLDAIALLRPAIKNLFALGLGPETAELKTIVPNAITRLTPAELPNVISTLFAQEALAA